MGNLTKKQRTFLTKCFKMMKNQSFCIGSNLNGMRYDLRTVCYRILQDGYYDEQDTMDMSKVNSIISWYNLNK